MHFTEYDVRLAAYAAIVNENREILLAWYNGEGRLQPRWTMPGGGVDLPHLPEGTSRIVEIAWEAFR